MNWARTSQILVISEFLSLLKHITRHGTTIFFAPINTVTKFQTTPKQILIKCMWKAAFCNRLHMHCNAAHILHCSHKLLLKPIPTSEILRYRNAKIVFHWMYYCHIISKHVPNMKYIWCWITKEPTFVSVDLTWSAGFICNVEIYIQCI